jgi:hypothetical protein
MDALIFYSQRLSICCEHMGTDGILKVTVDEARDSLDDLVTIVEHDEKTFVPK